MTTNDDLFRTTDPRGRTVRCTEKQWSVHVLTATGDHLELTGQELAVRETVEKPQAIYRSSKVANRDVYYRTSPLYTKIYIRVVVGFRDPEGFVVTAMHSDGPEPGEVLIWPQS